jgi:hypothetical protein
MSRCAIAPPLGWLKSDLMLPPWPGAYAPVVTLISEANEMRGSQMGSQQRQTPGDAQRHLATFGPNGVADEEAGGHAVLVPADLADPTSPARIIAAALAAFGREPPPAPPAAARSPQSTPPASSAS